MQSCFKLYGKVSTDGISIDLLGSLARGLLGLLPTMLGVFTLLCFIFFLKALRILISYFLEMRTLCLIFTFILELYTNI